METAYSTVWHSKWKRQYEEFTMFWSQSGNKFIFILIIFTTPSARAGYDTRSIFKRSLTGSYSYSWTPNTQSISWYLEYSLAIARLRLFIISRELTLNTKSLRQVSGRGIATLNWEIDLTLNTESLRQVSGRGIATLNWEIDLTLNTESLRQASGRGIATLNWEIDLTLNTESLRQVSGRGIATLNWEIDLTLNTESLRQVSGRGIATLNWEIDLTLNTESLRQVSGRGIATLNWEIGYWKILTLVTELRHATKARGPSVGSQKISPTKPPLISDRLTPPITILLINMWVW